jgi:hypothetical protein
MVRSVSPGLVPMANVGGACGRTARLMGEAPFGKVSARSVGTSTEKRPVESCCERRVPTPRQSMPESYMP